MDQFIGSQAASIQRVGLTHSLLVIDWSTYKLSVNLKREMQRIFAIFYKTPGYFGIKGQNRKPQTLVPCVKRICVFLEFLIESQFGEHFEAVRSLGDLEYGDIKRATAKFKYSFIEIRVGLRLLFSPKAKVFFAKSSAITPLDIDRLQSPFKRKSRQAQKYFDDDLFRFLSNEAAACIKAFLMASGETPCDSAKLTEAHITPPLESGNFKPFLDRYLQYRLCTRDYEDARLYERNPIRREKASSSFPRCHDFERDLTKVDMAGYLESVNTAAAIILALYTGARYSELATFKVGCLSQKDGFHVISGRVFKTKSDSLLSGDDWIAIPILRDAIRVLEILAPIKRNDFLISSPKTVGVKGQNRPWDSKSFRDAVKKFVRKVDHEECWPNFRCNPHQFRHSLTRQLVKAKLGLAYVTFQMKHLYNKLSLIPNDVTLGYGNIAEQIHSSEIQVEIQKIKKEYADSIFDPESVAVGVGASTFKEKRKDYFEGMMAAGFSMEEIKNHLIEVGSPFVNVGLGYCAGRKYRKDDTKKPPCIGSLKCNPIHCQNAIVTREHLPQWRKVYEENQRMSDDPAFFYAKDQFQLAAEEARQVISKIEEGI
ncbi:site-specific integrase [bacterium]|nr:site-specific integrase [bacterium]